MEISLNASSVKSLRGSQSQLSVSTDLQDASAFDLLLSLPVMPSPTVESDKADEPLPDANSDNTTCQNCDSAAEEQQEPESIEETESVTEEPVQVNNASSVASIDAVAAQQNHSVEQPTNTEVESTGSDALSEYNATQPTADDSSQLAVTTRDASSPTEPASQLARSVATTEGVSNTESTQPTPIQAATTADSSQQRNSDTSQPRQPIPTEQEKPAIDGQQLTGEKAAAVAIPQQTEGIGTEEGPHKAVVSQPQADAVRRGQQRDRPARWYERDASEAPLDESDAVDAPVEQLQAAEVKEASAIQAIEQGVVDQPADLNQQLPTESDELGVTVTVPLSGSASTSATTSLANGLVSSNASTVEGRTNSSSETSPSIASASERTSGKALAGDNNKLESSQTGSQVDISRAEKARLVQRVARSFSRISPAGGNLQIRLHPPELGALAMQVRIEGKNMSARLTTESHAARDVILESLPQLRSRLAEQGYDVVQFTVDVASDGSSLGNQTGAGQGGQPGDSSENLTRQSVPVDLRRSNHLRRQLDSANLSNRAVVVGGISSGVDIQA